MRMRRGCDSGAPSRNAEQQAASVALLIGYCLLATGCSRTSPHAADPSPPQVSVQYKGRLVSQTIESAVRVRRSWPVNEPFSLYVCVPLEWVDDQAKELRLVRSDNGEDVFVGRLPASNASVNRLWGWFDWSIVLGRVEWPVALGENTIDCELISISEGGTTRQSVPVTVSFEGVERIEDAIECVPISTLDWSAIQLRIGLVGTVLACDFEGIPETDAATSLSINCVFTVGDEQVGAASARINDYNFGVGPPWSAVVDAPARQALLDALARGDLCAEIHGDPRLALRDPSAAVAVEGVIPIDPSQISGR